MQPYEQMFWNDDCISYLKSLAAFVQIFSDKTVSSLECLALVAYPVCAVLLSFSVAKKGWLVQSRHTMLASLMVEYAAEPQGSNNELTGME